MWLSKAVGKLIDHAATDLWVSAVLGVVTFCLGSIGFGWYEFGGIMSHPAIQLGALFVGAFLAFILALAGRQYWDRAHSLKAAETTSTNVATYETPAVNFVHTPSCEDKQNDIVRVAIRNNGPETASDVGVKLVHIKTESGREDLDSSLICDDKQTATISHHPGTTEYFTVAKIDRYGEDEVRFGPFSNGQTINKHIPISCKIKCSLSGQNLERKTVFYHLFVGSDESLVFEECNAHAVPRPLSYYNPTTPQDRDIPLIDAIEYLINESVERDEIAKAVDNGNNDFETPQQREAIRLLQSKLNEGAISAKGIRSQVPRYQNQEVYENAVRPIPTDYWDKARLDSPAIVVGGQPQTRPFGDYDHSVPVYRDVTVSSSDLQKIWPTKNPNESTFAKFQSYLSHMQRKAETLADTATNEAVMEWRDKCAKAIRTALGPAKEKEFLNAENMQAAIMYPSQEAAQAALDNYLSALRKIADNTTSYDLVNSFDPSDLDQYR